MSVENKPLPAIPAKRYFTIGEVSELCGVKAYVLRYWEQEFTQLKPMKRRGNRRYYQHHEVLLIRRIRDLLYEQGFTISGARNQLTDAAGGHAHALSSSPSPSGIEPLDADAMEDDGADRDGTDADADRRGGVHRNPAARTRAGDARREAAERADLLAPERADELDDAMLEAMAREDLATIARATSAFGEVAKAPPTSAPATAAKAVATGARAATPQARRTAGSSPAPAPLDAVYTTAQIRDELLAIRSLLVS
jgi:DNA-binding transcriptional MerR regulator